VLQERHETKGGQMVLAVGQVVDPVCKL